MPYEIGDTEPPHIDVHDALNAEVAELSTRTGIPVVLPPIVSLGDTGHVNDHNLFTTAIQKIADGIGPALEPATIVTPPTSTGTPGVTSAYVRDTAGTRLVAYVLPGDVGTVATLALTEEGAAALEARRDVLDAIAAADVPDDFEGDPVTLLPKKLRAELKGFVEVRGNPQDPATYTVTLGAGTFPGVLVGSGGAGGSAKTSYGGAGGGAGAVIGHGAHFPVILPVPGDATYTITVGPTSPGGSASGIPVLSTGLPTTISVQGMEPFNAAIGGGRGWGYSTGPLPAASGASGGGGFSDAPYGTNNYGLGVPGLGNDGAPGPVVASGSWGAGGGGYSGPGDSRDGGAGFDLATALNLSKTDSATLQLLALITADGFIAGGGTGGGGGTATGGGGQYNDGLDAQDYTGGSGSGSAATVSGSGGAGMAVLIGPA